MTPTPAGRRASARSHTTPPTPPGIFDVRQFTTPRVEGAIERVALDELELAVNPRRQMSAEGLQRLAAMMLRFGQFVPAIGRRVAPDRVLLYAGQRRLRAAQLSAELAGSDGYEDLKPIGCLIVLLVDYEPTEADIRRIQAHENQREDLSMADQQEQFRDCWEDRARVPEGERIALVCADLGISPKKAHNLRRCLTLPDTIRTRVAERPAGPEISIAMANRLADMQQISPPLVSSVAARLTSRELHDRALKDLGGFVHKTIVEDPTVYAVRIDDGALLDAHHEIERARAHLTDQHTPALQAMFATTNTGDSDGGKVDVEAELDGLTGRAKRAALKIRVDRALRDRAANGRYAWVHHRGQDFADGIWLIDPLFLIDCAHQQLLTDGADQPAKVETFFSASNLTDEEMAAARAGDEQQRRAQRARQQEATASNLGLGSDIAASLLEPHGDQLKALRDLVCHLIAQGHPDVIAYGAGWTDRTNQQPVGDSKRYEPKATDAILERELQRALEDPDPLRGIALLLARFCAAFVLDPDGVTKTKTLGTDRMARRLRDALPSAGTGSALRDAVWRFISPMLSPRLRELHRDAFITEELPDTVDLQAHRTDSSLQDLDLGPDPTADDT
jgi:ParB-like chromosome segregation protein Spo0J